MNTIHLRSAELTDTPAIKDINNHYILNTVLTFVTEEKTQSDIESLLEGTNSSGLPFIVAEDTLTKTIVGYCYVSQFRDGKPAYAHTLELVLYCHAKWVRQGIGRKLLDRLMSILEDPLLSMEWLRGDRLTRLPAYQLLAVMAVDVEGPKEGLGLRDWYLGHGFEQVGHLKKVGYKKQRWVDVLFLQLDLEQRTGRLEGDRAGK